MNQTAISSLKPPQETRVVVAMSGGVDSSTVAALLHDQGYEVIGVTLQLYDQGVALQKKGACCAGQDIYDAKTVADSLGIPHYVLDYESLFKESVIDDFTESYMRGETPIPCVRCNQSVKFRDLLKVAKDLEADALATGHYVQRKDLEDQVQLHQGIDPTKDQSYFLFATTSEQLSFLHFPLGGLTKEETRSLALKYGLSVADKPESQDICFVPNGNYAELVKKLRPDALDPGEIVHINGEVLGQHEGIIHYTVGQRRGLGVSYPEPLYVIRLDPENKRVYVGPDSALAHTTFSIKEVNWIGQTLAVGESTEVEVKVRSTHSPVAATATKQQNGAMEIKVKTPERAVTPGQACVIYQGTHVLGGGWITREIE